MGTDLAPPVREVAAHVADHLHAGTPLNGELVSAYLGAFGRSSADSCRRLLHLMDVLECACANGDVRAALWRALDPLPPMETPR